MEIGMYVLSGFLMGFGVCGLVVWLINYLNDRGEGL